MQDGQHQRARTAHRIVRSRTRSDRATDPHTRQGVLHCRLPVGSEAVAAVVVATTNQDGKVFESDGELLNDLQQFERLEVTRRRLTVGPTLTWKLAIEIVEEVERRSHLAAFSAHPSRDSDSAMRCSTLARARSTSPWGASSRFVTMLASKRTRRSVGLIASSSAAVTTCSGTSACYIAPDGGGRVSPNAGSKMFRTLLSRGRPIRLSPTRDAKAIDRLSRSQ